MSVVENVRAPRSDKGHIKLTQRDLDAFQWLSDMKAISEPDLAVLLARLAGREQPASESAVRRIITRWHKAGVATGRKVMFDEPRIVFLQAGGAQLVGERQWRDAAMWTALHAADVSRARLWLEGHTEGLDLPLMHSLRVGEWQSERRWRQEHAALFGKLNNGVHVPDAVVTTMGSGKRVAIEVERTPKPGRALDKILDQLLDPRSHDGVLYLTRGLAVQTGVQAAYKRARERGVTVPLDIVPMPGPLT